jgi:RNA polymerase sigma factor (sigma-70 family)
MQNAAFAVQIQKLFIFGKYFSKIFSPSKKIVSFRRRRTYNCRMQCIPDFDLLGQFARNDSEEAFGELVRRYIGLVHSVALRHTDNPDHAEEITQAVFIILARKAASLTSKTVLGGWLYHTARLTAANFRRAEFHRIHHEQEAFMQSNPQEAPTDPAWLELVPMLDEAMARLGAMDRDAVVLRYFENKTLSEVGVALGLEERAAQKRVHRAVEKLHRFFSQHGVSSTTASIAGAISAHSVQTAPVALAKSVTAVAVTKGAAVSSSTLTLIKGALKIMAWTKVKTAVVVAAGIILATGTTTLVVKTVHWTRESAKESRVSELFRAFVAEQRAQAISAAAAEGKQLPPECDTFFAAAAEGDLPKMRAVPLDRHPWTAVSRWAVAETLDAFEMFSLWDEKYALAYGRNIVESMPGGSIYFTGVPMGAKIVPALQKPHANVDACLIINPFMFTDERYRTYLRSLYGGRMNFPSEKEVEKCYQDYAPDAWLREQQHKLVRNDFQQIGILIAKVIFEKNPDRGFYYEEALPIDWMYPLLEPHGLILEINRQPLSNLTEDMVAKDHEFWVKQLQPMIGDWLTYDTPVKELIAWTERVRLKKDFSGFKGDRRFIEDTSGEQQIFSKLRTAIGGVYAWRADHATDPAEKERMSREANFAFRQAWALWPCSLESCSTSRRLIALLQQESHQSDAQLVQLEEEQCDARFNQKKRN